jgi:hypothetical protein
MNKTGLVLAALVPVVLIALVLYVLLLPIEPLTPPNIDAKPDIVQSKDRWSVIVPGMIKPMTSCFVYCDDSRAEFRDTFCRQHDNVEFRNNHFVGNTTVAFLAQSGNPMVKPPKVKAKPKPKPNHKSKVDSGLLLTTDDFLEYSAPEENTFKAPIDTDLSGLIVGSGTGGVTGVITLADCLQLVAVELEVKGGKRTGEVLYKAENTCSWGIRTATFLVKFFDKDDVRFHTTYVTLTDISPNEKLRGKHWAGLSTEDVELVSYIEHRMGYTLDLNGGLSIQAIQ